MNVCLCARDTFKSEHYPPENHLVSICRLKNLLELSASEDCYDQHIHYLNCYINACSNGFFVLDLTYLTQVLELLTDRLEAVSLYKEYLKKLLDLCRIPPLLHTMAEELTEIEHFATYMSTLGLIAIRLTRRSLRRRIYRALRLLLTEKKRSNVTCSIQLRLNATEKSYLPEIGTQLIEFVPTHEYLEVLQFVLVLSQISTTVCNKMVEVGALNYLLLRLLPQHIDKDNPNIFENFNPNKDFIDILDITCQVLLNLVRTLKRLDLKVLENLTPSKDSFWVLRYVFREIVISKNSKLYRNNLMEFILLCLEIFPEVPIMECDLADDLAYLSVATEINFENAWITSVEFTNDEYDICFKKMLLLSLCFLEKYPKLYLIYENRNVVSGLLEILTIHHEHTWHLDDYNVIIKYALIALYTVAPYLMEQFISHNGSVRLLVLVELYLMDPNVCSEERIEDALKILDKLVYSKNESLIRNIQNHFGVPVLTFLCINILKKPNLTSSNKKYLAYAFSILSVLFSNNPMPGEKILTILIQYLKRVIKPNLNDSCIDPRTLICAINLLWDLTLTNEKRMSFMEQGGVYLLLDLIQISPLPVQVVGLGCLVDLCEDHMCVPYLLTWRGGHDRKIIFMSLLAEIFMNECRKIEMKVDSNNIITDVNHPLMGIVQYCKAVSAFKKDLNVSLSCMDVLASTRPKIYALIQLLKTRHTAQVDLINEHYKISNLKISTKNQIAFHLAENFFALKLAEAWNELKHEIIHWNIRPVISDAQILETIINEMQLWNNSVRDKQEAIFNKHRKQLVKETAVYDVLRKCRLQNAIHALREMKFLAQTTDRMFMLEYKHKQLKEIEASLQMPDDAALIRTYNNKINVTNVFHQDFNLDYNMESDVRKANNL